MLKLKRSAKAERSALKVSASAQAIIDARDRRIAEQAVELADAATLAGTLREQYRHSLDVLDRQAGEIRDLHAEADAAEASIAESMPAGMVTVSQESLDARTARAEQAEATAATLRDGNAWLVRRVADAIAALRQIADAPPGTTHAVKTTLAAAGLAALAGDAGEAPAGAHGPSEGRAEGFLA